MSDGEVNAVLGMMHSGEPRGRHSLRHVFILMPRSLGGSVRSLEYHCCSVIGSDALLAHHSHVSSIMFCHVFQHLCVGAAAYRAAASGLQLPHHVHPTTGPNMAYRGPAHHPVPTTATAASAPGGGGLMVASNNLEVIRRCGVVSVLSTTLILSSGRQQHNSASWKCHTGPPFAGQPLPLWIPLLPGAPSAHGLHF